jgi:hypothetical protein
MKGIYMTVIQYVASVKILSALQYVPLSAFLISQIMAIARNYGPILLSVMHGHHERKGLVEIWRTIREGGGGCSC